jgi:DHA2 family methylenomycin A resistance protein-like MFS transporter
MVAESRSSVHQSRPAAAIAVAGIGAFLCSLDSALNVAFPAISADLGVSPRQVALVIVFYHVPIGILTVIGGLLGDRFGHRRVFACGVWTSALAFPLCGLAPDYGFLLAARAVQGAGAGLVFGTAPALVALTLVPGRRGQGLGVLNVAAGVGLATAPLIAGVLVDAFGWRSVFLFRVPLSVVVLGALAWAPGAPAGPRRPGDGAPSTDPRPPVSAAVWLACAAAVIANAASFPIYVFVPYFLIDAARRSATLGGAVFATVPLSTSLGGLSGGWLTRRVAPRQLVVAGLAVETVGLLAITTLEPTSPVAWTVLALSLTGVGLGLFQVPNMTLVMAALPDRNQGLAGGMISAMRTVGVLAAALLSPLLFAARQSAHRSTVGDDAASFAAAFTDTFAVCAALGAAGLALAIVLRRLSR